MTRGAGLLGPFFFFAPFAFSWDPFRFLLALAEAEADGFGGAGFKAGMAEQREVAQGRSLAQVRA